MTNTEILLEAVTYAQETDVNWWEIFDSKNEALKILKQATKEIPDEHQIAEFLLCREDYIEDYLTADQNYRYILKKLRKELQEIEE